MPNCDVACRSDVEAMSKLLLQASRGFIELVKQSI